MNRQENIMQRLIATTLLAAMTLTSLNATAADAGLFPIGVIGSAWGSGPMPAVAEVREDLQTHTLYRPATLPAKSLPLLVWGNGACRDDGLAHEAFLREIASHGYIVIALGRARVAGAPATRPALPPGVDETDAAQMTEAMDWAALRNGSAEDELAGHIDV